jgi:hypothetical protein
MQRLGGEWTGSAIAAIPSMICCASGVNVGLARSVMDGVGHSWDPTSALQILQVMLCCKFCAAYDAAHVTPESSAAWRELLGAFAEFDNLFLDGPKAVRGQPAVAEGYQIGHHAALSLDMHFFADPVAPRFIDVLTPFRPDRRWGGDNTDCYSYAVVDPRRTYRVSGIPNDSAMYC